MNDSARATLTAITPFFIVRDLPASIAFYRDRLGFRLTFAAPEEAPFFGILARDEIQVMLKCIGPDVHAIPNPTRHAWARWDAFVHTDDPDRLALEFESNGVTLHTPVSDTDDGLRGCELRDPDGYVLFFGHPR